MHQRKPLPALALIGTLYLGFFATGSGLFLGGGLQQLALQFIAAFAVLGYSFVIAWVVGTVIEKTIGFRLEPDAEVAGVDSSVHGENAYDMDVRESV